MVYTLFIPALVGLAAFGIYHSFTHSARFRRWTLWVEHRENVTVPVRDNESAMAPPAAPPNDVGAIADELGKTDIFNRGCVFI